MDSFTKTTFPRVDDSVSTATCNQSHVRGNIEEETDMHVDGITLVALREETERERLRRRFTTNWSTEANYGSGESNDLCSLSMSKIIGTEMTVQEETIAINGKDNCLLPNTCTMGLQFETRMKLPLGEENSIRMEDIQEKTAHCRQIMLSDELKCSNDKKCDYRHETDDLSQKREKHPKSSKEDVMADLSVGFFGQYHQTKTKDDEGKLDADNMTEMWTLSSKDIYSKDKNLDNDDYKIENTDDTEEASTPRTSVKCEAQMFSDCILKNETEDKENTESRKTKHRQKEDLEELNSIIGTATPTPAVKDSDITVQFDIHVTSKIDDGKSDEENEKSDENNEKDDVFVKDEEGEGETEEEDFVDDLINEDDYISIENKRNGDTAEPCYDAEDIFDFE